MQKIDDGTEENFYQVKFIRWLISLTYIFLIHLLYLNKWLTPFTQFLVTEALVSSAPFPFYLPFYSLHYQFYLQDTLSICLLSYYHHHSPSPHCLSDSCNSFHTGFFFYVFPIQSILYSAARLVFDKCKSNPIIPLLKRKTNKRHTGWKGRNKTISIHIRHDHLHRWNLRRCS